MLKKKRKCIQACLVFLAPVQRSLTTLVCWSMLVGDFWDCLLSSSGVHVTGGQLPLSRRRDLMSTLAVWDLNPGSQRSDRGLSCFWSCQAPCSQAFSAQTV